MTVCLAVSDLDHTLIWPARDVSAEHQHDRVCVEHRDTLEQSFVSASGLDALTALATAGVLVPATARTPRQLERVRLPGPPPTHAVCLNGARVLVNGNSDPEFEAHASRLLSRAAPFAVARKSVHEHCQGRAFIRRVREADGTFLYLLHDVPPPVDWLAQLAEVLVGLTWVAVAERRRTYVVPGTLGKEHAVGWLRDRLDGPDLVAAGDGLLDREMLGLARRSIVPRGSTLSTLGARATGQEVTAGAGTVAGTEIARWLLQRALSIHPGAVG